MKERVFSAILLVAILAVLIFFSHIPFVLPIAVAILAAASVYEVLIATKYVESKALMAISLLFAVLIPFIPDFTRSAFTVGLFLYAAVLFLTLLATHRTFQLEHLSVIFFLSVIIPYFFSTLIYAREMENGFWNLLFIFVCSWCSDTGGYIFGRLFGRRKLCPNISPKKTVEGFVGGIFAGVVICLILSYAVDLFFVKVHVNYLNVVLYAIVGSLCAVLGDLSASMVKRSFGVKDFGKLIPGHGGIMDRFDSVLFVSPMVYSLLYYIAPIYTVVG